MQSTSRVWIAAGVSGTTFALLVLLRPAARKKAGITAPMPNWRLHDIRRTARTLMSRAGIPSDTAERVLGHRLQGVRRNYDRHDYVAEKRAALSALGEVFENIRSESPSKQQAGAGSGSAIRGASSSPST